MILFIPSNIQMCAILLMIVLFFLVKTVASNQMVANPSKFQIMQLIMKNSNNLAHDIENVSVAVVNNVKPLGITVDWKLKFNQHVAELCQKANKNISAFPRISNYVNEKQPLLLYYSFIMPQFNYCSLMWIFCGKVANNYLNLTHKRALRILFNDFSSSYEKLLQRGEECTFHQKIACKS